MKNVRWEQRFQNYKKSLAQLENALQIKDPSDTERAGLIQFFELSFELAWKTLKDYLESQGFEVNSPRETFKQAFQAKVISHGDLWIEALDNRNLTVHTYDEAICMQIVHLIKQKYFPLLKKLHQTLQSKKSE